jgi:hypothetical protein
MSDVAADAAGVPAYQKTLAKIDIETSRKLGTFEHVWFVSRAISETADIVEPASADSGRVFCTPPFWAA